MKILILLTLTCVFVTACRTEKGSAEPPVAAPALPETNWDSSNVQCGDLEIHYWRTGGEGKPAMVMAHGITDYGLNWTSLARRFEQDYDIILYDARGHGFSDKPDGPYDLRSHVQDLYCLISQLDLESPILMGHSMGGGTVAALAATYPDLPRALILEDPADMLTRDQPLSPGIVPDWKKRIEADQALGKEGLIELARTERHPGWTDLDYQLWAESKLMVHPNVVDILQGEGFGDALVTYSRVTVPTLILKADADEESRARHREIAGYLPNGKIVHIDGAGHVIRNDRPVETEREIREFLEELGS